jgi:L-cystine uptake protein TcyP (sodium:dicarboxylate symporter family)
LPIIKEHRQYPCSIALYNLLKPVLDTLNAKLVTFKVVKLCFIVTVVTVIMNGTISATVNAGNTAATAIVLNLLHFPHILP